MNLLLRSSPYVELKALAELTPEQRRPLADIESDAYGLLIPHAPLTMNLKSVPRETAELFQALPARVAVSEAIVDLVLDGILEVERDGDFVCGADALAALRSAGVLAGDGAERTPALLSLDALLHAQDLETADAHELTTALYLYNHIPLSPFWKARFPSAEAVLEHLGKPPGQWFAHHTNGWLTWMSPASRDWSGDDVTYKLYVSPRPERIREAFAAVVRVLSRFEGTQFKIGDSAAGLLRPDKLVAYFTTREQLDAAASELARELAGCEAHGVPFTWRTGALASPPLLSWGVDPPESDQALRWLGRESWRFWVVSRLGAAMSIAKLAHTADAVEPWRFAVERLRRHGVDVETWT